ncbi:hypothetical protein CRUP_033840 [Coryphaenoides rupestris]|nr:hypothetical protein CRUP_033840 [Coryphaenoides rupestris]
MEEEEEEEEQEEADRVTERNHGDQPLKTQQREEGHGEDRGRQACPLLTKTQNTPLGRSRGRGLGTGTGGLPLWPRPGMGLGGRGGIKADDDDEEEVAEEEGWACRSLWDGAPGGSWLLRLRMLSMAHCRCSVSVSSGGLPLEKLALSMSGESDLQRLAGSSEEEEEQEAGSRGGEASGEGGPGACWSVRNTEPGRCRWLLPLARL